MLPILEKYQSLGIPAIIRQAYYLVSGDKSMSPTMPIRSEYHAMQTCRNMTQFVPLFTFDEKIVPSLKTLGELYNFIVGELNTSCTRCGHVFSGNQEKIICGSMRVLCNSCSDAIMAKINEENMSENTDMEKNFKSAMHLI